jgi:hypothetical protein
MTKAEMEQYITSWLRQAKAENDEYDADRLAWKAAELERGTSESFFEDLFLYNGYVFASEVENIVAFALFDKPASIHHERNRYHGTYEERNLTEEERSKLLRVVKGMVARKMIRPSKSGTMYKVLI